MNIRHQLSLLLFFTCCFLTTKAQELSIIHTIPTPPGLSLDLAFDGADLWVSKANGPLDSLLYKVSKEDGSVLKTIPKDPFLTAVGLTFAGGYLYMTDSDPNLIHKVDTTDGTILTTYNAPVAGTYNHPSGLAWDGNSFWMIEAYSGTLFEMDTSFNVLQQIDNVIGFFGSGLTFANGNLWFTENVNDKLYELDLNTFDILQTFDITQDIFPNGLAFDGQYLWMAISADYGPQVDSLYQIDIGLSPPVAVDELVLENLISVYPNPSDGWLTFDLNALPVRIEMDLIIYDQLGRVLLSQKVNQSKSTFSINSFLPGTYVYKLRDKKQFEYTGKFVVF